MAKLQWDQAGERLYQTGDKQMALFVFNSTTKTIDGETTNYYNGVAWNGITAVTESPSGAEPTDLWADDTKYATMRSAEQFGGTIEAYTYPDAWEQCDGSITTNGVTIGQQARKAFGLAYITTVGNDTELNDYGEKLHLVYNATANPSERSYATINDSPEAITFSWEFTTTPIDVGEGYKRLLSSRSTPRRRTQMVIRLSIRQSMRCSSRRFSVAILVMRQQAVHTFRFRQTLLHFSAVAPCSSIPRSMRQKSMTGITRITSISPSLVMCITRSAY